MKTIEAYQCEYCRTKRYVRAAIDRHELRCKHKTKKLWLKKDGIKKTTKKINCDKLALMMWSELVKANAGYKSEISGLIDNLQSHHIFGKTGKSRCLRYSLRNGICLTAGEHNWFAHGTPSKQIEFSGVINKIRLYDIKYCDLKGLEPYTAMKSYAGYLLMRDEYTKRMSDGGIRDTEAAKKINKALEKIKWNN